MALGKKYGTAPRRGGGGVHPKIGMAWWRIAFIAMGWWCILMTGPAAAHDPPLLVEYLPDTALDTGDRTEDQNATLEAIRRDPAAIDIRLGPANPDAVREGLALSLVLPAPPGSDSETILSFHALHLEDRAEQDYSLYFRDEESGSEVALVVLGRDVLGTVRHGDALYKIHPLGDGLTAVYRYDTSRLPQHSLRDEALPTGRPRSSPVAHEVGARAEVDEAIIDILVAYTPRARIEAGNIDALLRFTFEETNRIYANSLIRPRVRLIHRYQTEYAPGADPSTDLRRLQARADSHMDEVHVLRDEHAGDLVVLLVGSRENYCYAYYSIQSERYAFAAIARNCLGLYGFAKLLGFMQGAAASPEFRTNRDFPYGHGFCNDADNWRTVMADNRNHRCPVPIPYFSNPDVSFGGIPTGDVELHNNARVINETAERVAGFREAPPPRSLAIPLFLPADDPARQGFVRIVNRSGRHGTVLINAIDDDGRRFGPVSLSLDANASAHFNSEDLEEGNPRKGLSAGVGNGHGNWRLELDTGLDIEPRAYVRTSDGFLTSIHEIAAKAEGTAMHYRVPIFNPASNVSQQSRLRLVNPGEGPASVVISGLDDRGEEAPEGDVTLTLEAGAARSLTARQLEEGGDGFAGRFGDGTGKWQLLVSATRPVVVMSLLQSPTGNLTNLSP